MGGMGGGDKGTSTQINKTELPPHIVAASQQGLDMAQKVIDKPYQSYKGPTVAPLSQEFYNAQGMLPSLDDYAGNYQTGSNTLTDLTGFHARDVDPRSVQAGMLKDTDLNPYLNPYIQNVENYAIENAERAGQRAQQGIQADASKASAYGGSRQAIQQAVQGAETTRGIGDLSAQLRMQGYDKATANAIADLDRKLKADTQTGQWGMDAQTSNQRADIDSAGVRRGAATDLADVADQAQQAKMMEISAQLGIGQMGQEQTQREYDAAAAKWEKKHNADYEDLQTWLSAINMVPYGKTETTTKQSETQGGGGAAGAAGSFLQMLPMMKMLFASDRSLKTDIEPLGTDPVTELPLYAYRYKKDPKTYPKTVGPMAQDVEKKYPRLVRKVGGKRVIDLTRLGA